MSLKEDIQAQAARIRKHKKVRGLARNAQWQIDRHGLRTHARHQLLAQAMLRGTPYQRVEAKCAEPPSALGITYVLIGREPSGPATQVGGVTLVEDSAEYTARRNAVLFRIKAWLAAPLREAA